jgi:biopolymer transport protein ExbD
MKIRQRPTKKARIEIIPMIDVIFFLLVFFMVSSLALTRMDTIPVSLPKVTQGSQALEQKIVLTVKKDGSLFVNQTVATLDTVGTLLAYEMRQRPQEFVVVHADQGAPYGQVVQAMDRAKAIGVRKFALATEAEGKKGKK